MEIRFQFDNLKEFTGTLRALPKRLQREGLKPAVRAGARVVLRHQKQKLRFHISHTADSESRGLLEQALRTVTIRERPSDATTRVVALIGITKKSLPKLIPGAITEDGRQKGRVPFYWHFLEYGYSEYGVRHPARPFVNPSFAESKSEVESVMQAEINRAWIKIGQGGRAS